MSRKYFGTDGIRGRVGQFPITPDFMLKLGWAAGMAFRKQGNCRVLVGKDTRISGYMFESALEAGLSAAGLENEARRLFAQRNRTRRFTSALDKTFALRSELKHLAAYETFVCRCEDVRFGELRTYTNAREAKLQTRCGMGACQGRVCGAATEFLFGWERGSVRPPIFPVKMENL